jgi:hypothetical protein
MNLLYCFIISKILVYIFKSFCLTNPWNPIEKGCHTNCVTFLAFLTTYFDEHIRPIIIIKQIQNMNLMLNMKDVNKILAKTHFKCKKVRKKTYFLQVWWALAPCIFINCVTFLAFLTTYFDEHCFWKKIFQWYFVGTGK